MRRAGELGVWFLLSACGGGAEIEGTALGIEFSDTRYVFFGGPFVAVSNIEVDCEQLAFVRSTYEVGQSATEEDMQLLQMSWAAGEVDEGLKSIGITASVSATVVKVSGGAFDFAYAESGVVDIESVTEDKVIGTFEGITFEDGSLTGEFDARWCRNLKDR